MNIYTRFCINSSVVVGVFHWIKKNFEKLLELFLHNCTTVHTRVRKQIIFHHVVHESMTGNLLLNNSCCAADVLGPLSHKDTFNGPTGSALQPCTAPCKNVEQMLTRLQPNVS